MRFEGSLTVWHVERGYGAVLPEQGGQELFIHISAFPQEGPQPVVGERISFEIVSGRNNQKQASKVQRLKAATTKPGVRPSVRSAARRPVPSKPARPVLAYVLFGVAVAAGLLSWLLFNPANGQQLARAARLASSSGAAYQSVSLPQGSDDALRSAPLRVRSTASKA